MDVISAFTAVIHVALDSGYTRDELLGAIDLVALDRERRARRSGKQA
jgi:hypothetical protein